MHSRRRGRLNSVTVLASLIGGWPQAHAETVPTRAARAVTIGPCVAKRSARCWTEARLLRRFAPEIRVDADPIETEVRLAHDGSNLLVYAPKLPADSWLEVVVGPDDQPHLAKAQVVLAGRGMHTLSLSPRLQTGKQRALRVHLRQANDPVVRTWAPHGHGDLTRPAWALFSPAAPEPAPTVTVTRDGSGLEIQAPHAAHLRLAYRRAQLPKGGRGIPAPWSAVGTDLLDTGELEQSGWYDLMATWLDEGGNITHQAVRELYLNVAGAPHALDHGIHPAPQKVTPLDEQPFVLQPGARVCVDVLEWLAAGKLARRELERFTGIQVSEECAEQTPGPADIWWHAEPGIDPEGYRIEVGQQSGAHIYASDLRGAVYGGLALVDGLGADATLAALRIEDAPVLRERILFHKATIPGKTGLDPDDYVAFIERAVARGRFNMLVLHLAEGYRYQSHPQLARPNAWGDAELSKVIRAARSLGIAVVPGINSPGHAQWITAHFPELKEDAAGSLLCPRHPDTRPLLSALMEDLLQAFGHPGRIHIGHDEAWWKTRRVHEIQRCPRCEGTPRWLLFTEDIQWHHDWLAQRDTRPILWSDMLVKGWHGGNGSIYRASNRLPESERANYLVMSWTRVGDSIGELGGKGYPIVRGHTGYNDWKRTGLGERVDEIAGEALAMYYATPWTTFGGQTGPITLYHHWPNVILAGATGWRPDLANTAIAPTLDALRDASAYTPGFSHTAGESRSLPLSGVLGQVDAVLPESAAVGGVVFDLTQPRIATPEDSIGLSDVGRVQVLSLLQATETTREADLALLKVHRKASRLDGPVVVTMKVRYADGQNQDVPIHLGMDTERAERPVRGQMLWRAAGTLRAPARGTAPLAPSATDRAFYRWDWTNPRPDEVIESIEWAAHTPGTRWLLLGATATR